MAGCGPIDDEDVVSSWITADLTSVHHPGDS